MAKGESVLKPKAKFDKAEILSFFKSLLLASQNTVGVDVGQGYIKIVQLQKGRRGYMLTDYRVRAIPYKIKDNLKERNKFIKEFISEFLSQSKIKTKLGRLAIKGSGVFVFSFILPPLADKDLRGAVGIELKKRLPFQIDFNNISFNYMITDRIEEENASVMVSCLAVDNSVVDKQLEFLKSFNLTPVVLNAASDALGNLIGSIGVDKYTAVLDMGVKQSYLNFYKGANLQFNREIPVGGEQLTQGVLKVLTPLVENITFEDAEAFKRQCGIPMQEEISSEFYTDFGAVKGEQIIAALRPTLERLITEVSRTMTFYFRTYKQEGLDAFYLTGGASRIKNIDRFLSSNLGSLPIKTIEKLNPLKAVKGWFDAGVFKQELVMEEAAPHLATAFGLCLDNGGRINFIPAKEKIEQKALSLMFLVRITFPLLLIVFLGMYLYSYGRGLIYQGLTVRNESGLRQMEASVKEINDYYDLKKRYEERQTLLNRAVGRQPIWWGVLKELAQITPEEITLHRLELKSSGTPRKLVLVGEVLSEYTNVDLAISQYTMTLSESSFFANVDLVSTERDVYSPLPRAIFQISMELKA